MRLRLWQCQAKDEKVNRGIMLYWDDKCKCGELNQRQVQYCGEEKICSRRIIAWSSCELKYIIISASRFCGQGACRGRRGGCRGGKRRGGRGMGKMKRGKQNRNLIA